MDLAIGAAAIERARTAVASESRRVPAHVDVVTPLVPGALGSLAAAGPVSDALAAFARAVDGELVAGGQRLALVDRALDATLTSIQTADADAARSLGR